MPFKQADDIFDQGVDILGTTQTPSGCILAQTGDVSGEQVSCNEAEVWGPLGLAARPARADAGKQACQAIAIKSGSVDACFAYRDLRTNALYGTLREGEVCLYAPGPTCAGTGKVLLQDDGTNSTITITANALVQLQAAAVKLGNAPNEGVVLGGTAFQSWAGAVTSALQGLIGIVAATPAVNGAPLSTGATSLNSGLTFPSAEISQTVKASP